MKKFALVLIAVLSICAIAEARCGGGGASGRKLFSGRIIQRIFHPFQGRQQQAMCQTTTTTATYVRMSGPAPMMVLPAQSMGCANCPGCSTPSAKAVAAPPVNK
jgi:hypothetical protein